MKMIKDIVYYTFVILSAVVLVTASLKGVGYLKDHYEVIPKAPVTQESPQPQMNNTSSAQQDAPSGFQDDC